MNKTPLYDRHLELGAKMVDFAAWQMPLNYPTGISQEHVAVRTNVGLFDVSHMGEISILGVDALAFLQFATLNEPARLTNGRGQYSMVPNDKGGLVDDIYVYRNDAEDYLVICNAANREKVFRHLLKLSEGFDVSVVDASEDWALLALQGPGSPLCLARHVKDDIGELKKNRKMVSRLNGCVVDIARTGYTGEDGFEILCRPHDLVTVWDTLLESGAIPCGLGARDTLRLEAGFPLFGHEFNEATNPLCSYYAWVVKDKTFYGREAMWHPTCERQLVGLKLLGRGIARQGYKLMHDDKEVGIVTSGSISPFTRDSIALAWVDKDYADVSTRLSVVIRSDYVSATVSKPPFI